MLLEMQSFWLSNGLKRILAFTILNKSWTLVKECEHLFKNNKIVRYEVQKVDILLSRKLKRRKKLNSYPGEGNEGQRGHCSEHDGGDQHDQGNQNIIAEERDGSQPPTEKDTINTISAKHFIYFRIRTLMNHNYLLLDHLLCLIMKLRSNIWMLNANHSVDLKHCNIKF